MQDSMIYFQLISAIVAAAVGYILGQRSKKIDQFYNQLSESLNEICSPMFFDLKDVISSIEKNDFENKITLFFQKYSSSNAQIHKLGKVSIIEKFLEFEANYLIYKKIKTNDIEKTLKNDLVDFYKLIKKEYWEVIELLYEKYIWQQKNMRRNVFTRGILEFIRIFNELTKSLMALSCFVFLYSVIAKFMNNQFSLNYDQNFIDTVLVASIFLFLFSAIFWGTTDMIISSDSTKNRRKSKHFYEIFSKKFFPKKYQKQNRNTSLHI